MLRKGRLARGQRGGTIGPAATRPAQAIALVNFAH